MRSNSAQPCQGSLKRFASLTRAELQTEPFFVSAGKKAGGTGNYSCGRWHYIVVDYPQSHFKENPMHTPNKAEMLNIRASSIQKAKLAEAARLQNMNVSQFVLHKSLDAAEEVIADQRVIRLSAEEYDAFVAKLDEPPLELPKLRELFSKPSVLEK